MFSGNIYHQCSKLEQHGSSMESMLNANNVFKHPLCYDLDCTLNYYCTLHARTRCTTAGAKSSPAVFSLNGKISYNAKSPQLVGDLKFHAVDGSHTLVPLVDCLSFKSN